MKRLSFTLLLIIHGAASAISQIKQTENTLKLNEGQRGEPAAISEMAWLAGTWTGTGLGGISEEIWSRPKGGIMMGMYRMTKEDKPVFYELLTLSETDGSLLIRLKHFHPNFVGWEEKDKTVDFRFIKKEGKRIYFEGMTFELVGRDAVNVYLAIRQRDGSIREEKFEYKKVE